MRATIIEDFHETIGYCFNQVIQDMLGTPVRDELLRLLERNHIPWPEVAVRFDDVVKIFTNAFGPSARVIIYKTVIEMHREYFQPTDFPYEDSLRDRIDLLRQRILSDLIKPKHLLSDDSYYVPSPLARE